MCLLAIHERSFHHMFALVCVCDITAPSQCKFVNRPASTKHVVHRRFVFSTYTCPGSLLDDRLERECFFPQQSRATGIYGGVVFGRVACESRRRAALGTHQPS